MRDRRCEHVWHVCGAHVRERVSLCARSLSACRPLRAALCHFTPAVPLCAQMRRRGALVGVPLAVIVAALYHACPAAAFVGPGPLSTHARPAAAGPRVAQTARARVFARPAGGRVLGAVGLRAADEVEAQADRARKLIDEVGGGAASRLDQQIAQVKNPSNATAISGGQGGESKEEKMARARALIDKVRGGAADGSDKTSGDPPKTSSGIGGTW